MSEKVATVTASIWVVLLIIGSLIWGARSFAQAQPQPLFVVGQTYGVLYSCLEQIGCYGEAVRVRAVQPDGWIVAEGEDGKVWTINTRTILAFIPLNGQQVSR